MRLRSKLTLYLVVLHLALAVVAAYVLIDHPLALFAVEGAFVVSIIIGARLLRALFLPLDLMRTGTDLISEADLTTRFVPIGQPEVDTLVNLYNSMIDRLREERLSVEEQHQFLNKIVEASPSGIVICDFDGNIERMNPAAKRLMRGAVYERISGMKPGESRLVQDQGARRLKVWRAEFRDRGFPKTFFLLDEMTDELRLSEKAAYEKLIRMMSHEVNNSVGAVRSLLDSALRYERDIRDGDRQDFTSALTIASSRIDALNRFMRDFADVVRIPLPHRTTFSATTVINDIAALVRPELQQRNIGLQLQLDDARISADRGQFEQVVLNVVRNAIEATDRDGEVEIRLRDGELTVADSGPGISEDVRSELFNPFFSTKRDGRGLGLTIVQEILSNHGFGFTLQNRPDRGAQFSIKIADVSSRA